MRALQKLHEQEPLFAEYAAESRRDAASKGVSVYFGDSENEAALYELTPDGEIREHRLGSILSLNAAE